MTAFLLYTNGVGMASIPYRPLYRVHKKGTEPYGSVPVIDNHQNTTNPMFGYT